MFYPRFQGIPAQAAEVRKWNRSLYTPSQRHFTAEDSPQEQISEKGEMPWFVWGVLTMSLPSRDTPKRHLGVCFFWVLFLWECESAPHPVQYCHMKHASTLKNRELKNLVFSSSKALLILRKPAFCRKGQSASSTVNARTIWFSSIQPARKAQTVNTSPLNILCIVFLSHWTLDTSTP